LRSTSTSISTSTSTSTSTITISTTGRTDSSRTRNYRWTGTCRWSRHTTTGHRHATERAVRHQRK